MSLFGRIALTAAVLYAVAAALGLLVWLPTSQRAFEKRSNRLLRRTGGEFRQIATSVVDDVVGYSAVASRVASEQRALALADLPLDLYTDAAGRVNERRLKEALVLLVADPADTLPEKTAIVRAEILARTSADLERSLEGLRKTQAAAARRHGESAASQAVSAWGGLLLVLLAVGAFVLDRVVVRPMRAATDAVVRFGAGERGERLAHTGGAELVALARAFNETAAAVERAEAENRELREKLEDKVKERTDALVRAARASTAGSMAGGVAHEFNNLLGGILGCAESALEEKPEPEVRDAVEMIRKTAQRGVGVTKALLRATSAEPERAPFDPAALLDEALAEVRPATGIVIVRQVSEGSIVADAAMVRQVLSNLIRNAAEAMGERGTLTLSVEHAPGEVKIGVADTGPGIDAAVREILFEPFVTTRRGGREGVGLGLFLADRLVAAHGGRIDVESGPDSGTAFTIRPPSARDS